MTKNEELAQLREACEHVVDAYDELPNDVTSSLAATDHELFRAVIACALIINGCPAYCLKENTCAS